MAFNPILNLGDLNGRNGFVIKGLDIFLGWSVSGAGDVNGDGIDDLIISGSGERDYVIFGSNQDFGTSFDVSEIDGTNGFVIDSLSWSVSGAGDVNGDGIDDLIIGAPFATSDDPFSVGESYVVFGRNQGFSAQVNISDLNGSNGFVIEGDNNQLSFGRSVSGAGDINGDGTDDLIIGSPGGSSFNNIGSYVVFGNDQGFNASLDILNLNGSDGFGITGSDRNSVGHFVSGAGDINGDGIDDIIIGDNSASSNDDNLREGQSYVVFGSSQGFDLRPEYFNPRLEVADLNGSNGFVINGIDENDSSGISVSGAGDINGDGIDDLIIGAAGADSNSEFRAGESYVVFGNNEGFSSSFDLSNLNGSNGFVINGIDEGDFSGWSVSGAGDVNGDGFDDLIIGAPWANPNGNFFAGESYVVFGSDQGFSASLNLSELDGSNGFVIKGIDEWNFSGWSLSGAGDINDDGIDDLIIGASGLDENGFHADSANESYVVFGMPQGNNSPTAVDDTFTTEEDIAATFDVLSNDTDPDGDRITINSVTQPNNGTVSVNVDNSLTYTPNSNFTGNDSFTYEISDGNNSTDTATVNLTVIEGEDPTTIELAPVLNLSDLNGGNGFVITGIDERDFSGSSVSGAGDVNGDGFDDIIIGAGSAEDGDNFYGGQSYVVFGGDQGFNENLNLSELDGSNGFTINGGARDFSGYSVSGAGDINGDGFDDLIIGSPWRNYNYNHNDSLARNSYVIFGSSEGFSADLNLSELDGSNGFVIGFDRDYYNFGRNFFSGSSVSAAGDINGDDIDDLIIGAPKTDDDGYNTYDTGKSYVIFGSDQGFSSNLNISNLNDSDGFALTGIDERDFSGSSVSGAGDFNGDGFDDLIIGAPDADPNGNFSAGESYVVFGSDQVFSQSLSDFNSSDGFVINGINEGDHSGVSVSGAGDVNGDGFDDLIIGAHRTDINGNLSVGESYVVFGSDQDFNGSLDLSDLNGSNGFVIKGIDGGDFSGRSVSAAGDVNGDGFDDLIIGAPGADPNGNLSAGESYVVLGRDQGFSTSLDLSDLDGRNGFVIKGIDGGDFSGRSVSGAGDINGDGVDDVIIGAPGGNFGAGESYVVFGGSQSNNSPTPRDNITYSSQRLTINGIYQPISGNFNGDSFGDILWYQPGSGQDDLWSFNSDHTYNSSPLSINGDYSPISGDFDGSGTTDIFWYQPGTGSDYLWLFNSDGSYQANPLSVNGNYEPIEGDFDGSGTTDILWYQPGTGSDYLWLFNSDGSYQANPLSVNGNYEPIEGDFDGSGTRDILWYQPGTGSDYLWLFNSDGTYQANPLSVNGDNDPITGDLDGSGTTDILWYQSGTGTDYLWSFNIDGTYDSNPFTVNGDYEPIEGDFNADNIDDILWYGSGVGADYIWTFQANGYYNSTALSINGVYKPVVEDFDGNGYTDILWYDAGDHSDYLWSFE